jgi:hypothetical protein
VLCGFGVATTPLPVFRRCRGLPFAQDRLHAVITLQCLGLRPEEACGLQWRRDIRPLKLQMSVNMARTLVDGKPIEKAPKTAAGCRTLPLDDALAASLTTFHALQAKERRPQARHTPRSTTCSVTRLACPTIRPASAGCGTG